jgi:precorrin-6B methylase 2
MSPHHTTSPKEDRVNDGPGPAPLFADLTFNSPMSQQRATAVVASLQPLAGARVVDLGCGWAELLLRIVASDPTATGLGVDADEAAIAHGQSNAVTLGVADRVELRVGDAATWDGEPPDVMVCVGAGHAWGDAVAALAALRPLVRDGGTLVFGAEFWSRPPTAEALQALGVKPDTYGSLADLVATATAHGFRPLAVAEASMPEWDEFESRYATAWERLLLAHPDDPGAEQVRARADTHRDRYLRGYRGVLGFAYLTLGVPGTVRVPG